MSDLVSIIIPVHNGEKYLLECLQSVKNQTYPEWEALIIDDCSTDASKNLIEKFIFKDSRFRLLTNNSNKGVAYSRKYAIKQSHGGYIAFLDCDDSLAKDSLEKLIHGIGAAGLCIGQHSIIKNNNILEAQIRTKAGIYQGSKLIELRQKAVYTEHGFDHMSVYGVLWGNLYRKDLIMRNLDFLDEKLWFSEDHVFFLAMLFDATTVSVISDCVYFYRSHIENTVHSYREGYFENSRRVYNLFNSILLSKGGSEYNFLTNKLFFLKNIEASMKREVRNSNKGYSKCIRFLITVANDPLVRELLQEGYISYLDKSARKYLTWLKYGWIRLAYFSLKF